MALTESANDFIRQLKAAVSKRKWLVKIKGAALFWSFYICAAIVYERQVRLI